MTQLEMQLELIRQKGYNNFAETPHSTFVKLNTKARTRQQRVSANFKKMPSGIVEGEIWSVEEPVHGLVFLLLEMVI